MKSRESIRSSIHINIDSLSNGSKKPASQYNLFVSVSLSNLGVLCSSCGKKKMRLRAGLEINFFIYTRACFLFFFFFFFFSLRLFLDSAEMALYFPVDLTAFIQAL